MKNRTLKKMNLQIFAEGGTGEGSGNGSGEGNQNQNNSSGEGEGNQQNQQQNQSQQNNTQNNQQTNTFDKEAYLKELGVDDEDSFKEYISKKKEEDEKNMTDLQKVQRTLDATTKELAKERKARAQTEAKLQAIKDGAKPELVDDLVAVAMTKVSNEKSVEQVLAEMKKDVSRSFYFNNSSSGENNQNNQNGNQNNGFTRGSAGNNQQQNNNQNNQQNKNNNQGSGTIAARLFARKYGKNDNSGK